MELAVKEPERLFFCLDYYTSIIIFLKQFHKGYFYLFLVFFVYLNKIESLLIHILSRIRKILTIRTRKNSEKSL